MPTLDWIGKKAVLNHHREVPFHLLKVDEKLSVGDPECGNLLVQGDNLLALKALLPYYAGQVKCIYIDPPYNTGKERWVYNDSGNSPEMRKWLGKVVGGEAEDLSRHDKWLCMMHPRLELLKRFLRPDGVIFISIGQEELGHLRLLTDEVFDRRNLLEVLIWETEGHVENQEEITGVHEYILVYARDSSVFRLRCVIDPNVPEGSKVRRDFAENSVTKNGPGNPASLITLPKGFPCSVERLRLPAYSRFEAFCAEVGKVGYITRDLTRKFKAQYPIREHEMVVEQHAVQQPCGVFSGWMAANKLRAFIGNGCKPMEDDGAELSFYLSNRGVVYYRRKGRQARYVQSVLRNMGTTERNRYELEAMGIQFPYPKPKELISYLLSLATEGQDLVLDSFFGSGTTAHAVFLLNRQDGGRRRFIGVELEPEICQAVARKRIACLVEGYTAQSGQQRGRHVEGWGGGCRYCLLGGALFDQAGRIAEEVTYSDLAAHVYFTETGQPLAKQTHKSNSPLLGSQSGVAVYLLFNGTLGDKSLDGGNVLTSRVLSMLPRHDGPRVIYGEGCRLSRARLKREGIVFRQIPYQIKVG